MANDFSGDSNCVILWRFESGALTADSKGGNTLTNVGPATEDIVDFKEGSCAVVTSTTGPKALYIPDASLDAGVPLKSGSTNNKISVCGWVQFSAVGDHVGPIGKGDTGAGTRSMRPLCTLADGRWLSDIGISDGDALETLYEGATGNEAQTGRWYHFGWTFEDSSKLWKLVIWDDTAGAKVVNASGTSTNNINVENASIRVGATSSFAEIDFGGVMNGKIDELVIFKDILTRAEITAIREGTYPNVQQSTFWPAITRLLDQ